MQYYIENECLYIDTGEGTNRWKLLNDEVLRFNVIPYGKLSDNTNSTVTLGPLNQMLTQFKPVDLKQWCELLVDCKYRLCKLILRYEPSWYDAALLTHVEYLVTNLTEICKDGWLQQYIDNYVTNDEYIQKYIEMLSERIPSMTTRFVNLGHLFNIRDVISLVKLSLTCKLMLPMFCTILEYFPGSYQSCKNLVSGEHTFELFGYTSTDPSGMGIVDKLTTVTYHGFAKKRANCENLTEDEIVRLTNEFMNGFLVKNLVNINICLDSGDIFAYYNSCLKKDIWTTMKKIK